MAFTATTTSHFILPALARVRTWIELIKFRLSFLVAFSSAFGFVLASTTIDWTKLFMLFTGGLLLSGASVAINQILERDYDKLMIRTQHRPLPTGRVSVAEATAFAVVCLGLALSVLWMYTNPLTTLLAFVSLLLYCFAYTPLKRRGPIAVFVGAIPGAMPPLLGWVAATGHVAYETWIIFGIQFIWQFPHFWAIAWVSDDDYRRAGFRLLPFGGRKDINTAIQIMVYALFLLPLGLLPAKFGLTGIDSAIVATVCGTLFLWQTFSLMKTGSHRSAVRTMLGSFLYLPIVQIAYLLDKL